MQYVLRLWENPEERYIGNKPGSLFGCGVIVLISPPLCHRFGTSLNWTLELQFFAFLQQLHFQTPKTAAWVEYMQSYGCITEHVEVSENIYFVEEFAVFRACQLLRNSTTYLKKYFHNVHNAGGEARWGKEWQWVLQLWNHNSFLKCLQLYGGGYPTNINVLYNVLKPIY